MKSLLPGVTSGRDTGHETWAADGLDNRTRPRMSYGSWKMNALLEITLNGHCGGVKLKEFKGWHIELMLHSVAYWKE